MSAASTVCPICSSGLLTVTAGLLSDVPGLCLKCQLYWTNQFPLGLFIARIKEMSDLNIHKDFVNFPYRLYCPWSGSVSVTHFLKNYIFICAAIKFVQANSIILWLSESDSYVWSAGAAVMQLPGGVTITKHSTT